MSEDAIVEAMKVRLAQAGAYFEKNHGTEATKGRPDLEFCLQGRWCAVEVKMPGEKATPIQLWTLEQIRAAGGYAGVLDRLEGLAEFLLAFPFACRFCLSGQMRTVEGLEADQLQCVYCGEFFDG